MNRSLLASLMFLAPTAVVAQQYTVAYAHFGWVRPNIFIADGTGAKARPLLSDINRNYNPSFSNDGRWIVFTSDRSGSPDLYRVHPDGSGLEQLTNNPALDDQGALSPDGKLLAFVSNRSGRANIWVLDLTDRRARNLTAGSSGDFRPAWSPDGQFIAFSSDRASPSLPRTATWSTEVFVMRADGAARRQVTHDGGIRPSWSPDGDIVYAQSPRTGVRETQIIAVNWRTGMSRMLTTSPGYKWTPRWTAGAGLTYIVAQTTFGRLSGRPQRADGDGVLDGNCITADWAPDGKMLVCDRETDTSWPPVERLPGRESAFGLLRTGIFPSFAPGGDRLVVGSEVFGQGAGRNSIVMMHADGSNRSVLFSDARLSALGAVWSPRGDRLAFGLGVPRGTSQIALLATDGTGLKVLAAAGEEARFPSWSPDGTRLVYATSKPPGLSILTVDTGAITQLISGPSSFPSWSPAGDRIAFGSNRDGNQEVYSIRPDGTNLKRLTNSPGDDAHPVWSPDGRWIAFTTVRGGVNDDFPGTPGEIYVMRADGTDARRLTNSAYQNGTPTWRPAARTGGR
jgi:Tol biopolymer transport system component